MPSPAAHSLIGLAVALVVLRPARCVRDTLSALWEQRGYLLAILFMANLPDIDYIPGVLTGRINAFHYEYTHTAGWVLAMAVALWFGWRRKEKRLGWNVLAVLLVAGATHLAADWVTDDQAAPFGIMAFWPLTDRRYLASAHVFGSLWKAEWSDVFKLHNVKVVLLEIGACLPLVAAAVGYQAWARRAAAAGLSEPGVSGKMDAEVPS
ncbi:MAG: metal-dependent hydrolase [Verrucomicrobiota bacterium]